MESYHQSLVPLNGQVIYLACDPASGKTAWYGPYEKGWGGLPHTNTWSQMEVIVLEKIGTQSSSQKLGEFMFILRDWIFSRPGQKQVSQSRICWLKGSEFTKVIHAPRPPRALPSSWAGEKVATQLGVSSPWLQHKGKKDDLIGKNCITTQKSHKDNYLITWGQEKIPSERMRCIYL